MQIRSKRERMMMLFGLPAALIILAWGLLSPSSAPASKVVLLPKDQALQKYQDSKSKLFALQDDETKLTPQVAEMSYSLPAEQLVPRMIRDLQVLSGKAGVHLREIKPLRPRLLTAGGGARVPVEVRFRAPFQPDAVRFLYFVEDPAGKMVVDKVNITSADPKLKTVDVSAQITVFTRSTAGVAGATGGDTNDVTDKSTNG